MTMQVMRLKFSLAKLFLREHHRHNKILQGHKATYVLLGEEDGLSQLEADGAGTAVAQLLQTLEAEPWDGSDTDRAKQLLGDAAKGAGVKKGIVMKSLRAALLGRLQGPDLITTWSLLARIGEDLPRLQRCLA